MKRTIAFEAAGIFHRATRGPLGPSGDPLCVVPWLIPSEGFDAADPGWNPAFLALWSFCHSGLAIPRARQKRPGRPWRRVRLTPAQARIQTAMQDVVRAQVIAAAMLLRGWGGGPEQVLQEQLGDFVNEWESRADDAGRVLCAIQGGFDPRRRRPAMRKYHEALIQWRALARLAVAVGLEHGVRIDPRGQFRVNISASRLRGYALGRYDSRAMSAGFGLEMPWRKIHS